MYELYQGVKLKDGRTGCIVDVYNDGNYAVELDNTNATGWDAIIIVGEEKIESED